MWLKLITCVTEPIALHGIDVWGPLAKQEFTKWDKHPIETCKGSRTPLLRRRSEKDRRTKTQHGKCP